MTNNPIHLLRVVSETTDTTRPLSPLPWGLIISLLITTTILTAVQTYRGYTFFPERPSLRVAEVARSLWDDHTLTTPTITWAYEAARQSSITSDTPIWQDVFSIGRNGTLLPKHALVVACLASPWYGIFGDAGFWLFQETLLIGLFVCWHRLSTTIVGRDTAILTLLVLGLGTQTLLHSTSFSYDLISGALTIIGIDLTRKFPFVGGLVTAATISIRPLSAAILPWLVGITPRRSAIAVSLGMATAVCGYLLINFLLWGGFFITSYTNTPVFSHGLLIPADHATLFSLDTLFRSWPRKLFDTSVGLCTYNPSLLLIPLALRKIRHHPSARQLTLYLLAATSLSLCVFSYQLWDESFAGNRFLFPAIYLALLSGLAALPQTTGLQTPREFCPIQ